MQDHSEKIGEIMTIRCGDDIYTLEKISLAQVGRRYRDYLKDNDLLTSDDEIAKEYEDYDPDNTD